jgi:NAD(P)H-dependent FMN reductase
MAAYKGKVAGIMAASPGGLGGMRVLVTLRMLLENIGTMVLPNQKAVGGAFKLFYEQGNITDEKTEKALKKIGNDLADTLQKLKAE